MQIDDAPKRTTGGVDLKKLSGNLKPVFETTVKRYTLPLKVDGSVVELSLDHGEIKTGRRRLPIHEIEIELKHGDPDAVVTLGREIAGKLDADYGTASKAERGYALREKETEASSHTQPILLSRKMSAAKAFQAVAMSCVRHFAGNRAAVLAGDAEGVHQMRVGLRRLRAAISIFKEMLRGPETEAMKERLEQLTEELGPARDMDVLAREAIAPMVDKTSVPAAVKTLKAEVVDKRDRGFDRARRAVASDRYRQLVLDAVLWINGGRWTTSGVAQIVARRKQPATRLARQELGRRTKKVLKKLGEVKDLSPKKRHKLRIAVKKLRYATGYFESLFDDEKKSVKDFARALKELQSSLGQLNDIRVHRKLAKDYATPVTHKSSDAAVAFAMGELTAAERAKSSKLLKATQRRGKKLKRCKQFWA